MAPFSKAVRVTPVTTKLPAGTAGVYSGHADGTWTIGSVPNGGYVLALLLEAAIQEQAQTAHRDPIHITAHYLKATAVAPFEVHVRRLKSGKGFSNLTAELIQKGSTCVLAHFIFGVLAPLPSASGATTHFALVPPSPYARIHPFTQHPAESAATPGDSRGGFNAELSLSQDVPVAGSSTPPRNGGVEWGSWTQFTDPNERITPSSVVFMADIFKSFPMVLPEEVTAPLGQIGWLPTLVLSIEFKFAIPRDPSFSSRTVGVYAKGTFINDPQGRHDEYVEVWTAPSCIGEGNGAVDPDWRAKQVCLAVSTQMALTMSAELNHKVGNRAAKL